MPSTRQLAAIMFTDIVGYTALMGEDEQKVFETQHKNINRNHSGYLKMLSAHGMRSLAVVRPDTFCYGKSACGEICIFKEKCIVCLPVFVWILLI